MKFLWDSVYQKLLKLVHFLTELFTEDIGDVAFLQHGVVVDSVKTCIR